MHSHVVITIINDIKAANVGDMKVNEYTELGECYFLVDCHSGVRVGFETLRVIKFVLLWFMCEKNEPSQE